MMPGKHAKPESGSSNIVLSTDAAERHHQWQQVAADVKALDAMLEMIRKYNTQEALAEAPQSVRGSVNLLLTELLEWDILWS